MHTRSLPAVLPATLTSYTNTPISVTYYTSPPEAVDVCKLRRAQCSNAGTCRVRITAYGSSARCVCDDSAHSGKKCEVFAGCMHAKALNFNCAATKMCAGCCTYPQAPQPSVVANVIGGTPPVCGEFYIRPAYAKAAAAFVTKKGWTATAGPCSAHGYSALGTKTTTGTLPSVLPAALTGYTNTPVAVTYYTASVVSGCSDSKALNFMSSANKMCAGCCTYAQTSACVGKAGTAGSTCGVNSKVCVSVLGQVQCICAGKAYGQRCEKVCVDRTATCKYLISSCFDSAVKVQCPKSCHVCLSGGRSGSGAGNGMVR